MMRVMLALIWGGILGTSCGSKKTGEPLPEEPRTVVVKKKDKPTDSLPDQTPAPVINLADTFCVPYQLLCVRDSALNSEILSKKLAEIFEKKLPEQIKKLKLNVSGPPHAWYKSQKAPFFFEAGLPIDKSPKAKLPKTFILKKTDADSAYVAHFFGPYQQTGLAYEVLKERFTDQKKKPRAAAYEVYIGNPLDEKGKARDPYKVQTDIVWPRN